MHPANLNPAPTAAAFGFGNLLLILLWTGLGLLTVGLLILMQTRWGRSRPIRKCLILSVLAHALFAGYATTVTIVTPSPALREEEPSIRVSLVDPDPLDAPSPTPASGALDQNPWDRLAHAPAFRPTVDPETRPPLETETPAPRRQSEPTETQLPPLPDASLSERMQTSLSLNEETTPNTIASESIKTPRHQPSDPTRLSVERPVASQAKLPKRTPMTGLAAAERPHRSNLAPSGPTVEIKRTGATTAASENPLPLPQLQETFHRETTSEAILGHHDLPTPLRQGGPAPIPPQGDPLSGFDNRAVLAETETFSVSDPPQKASPETIASVTTTPPDATQEIARPKIPEIYRLRSASDRLQRAARFGATPESEKAVEAALAWLARQQTADGSWNPRDHEAGVEQKIDGQDRRGAGGQADTGITGLTLLVFLAHGETAQQGDYQSTVQKGIDYLLARQRPDGNLSGGASLFAAMYCHAMATLAISENYSLTHDPRLKNPLRRAIDFTLAAQDQSGGGWRYAPGDVGDTSQLGWQLMALKSAELAGMPIPQETVDRIHFFLNRISSGTFNGLAAYQIGRQPSHAMTAEALACRVFLGMPSESPTADEAANFLVQKLPGDGRPNLYYWYYGTVGIYHFQDARWRRWNTAMQETLLRSQRQDANAAGSWDPATRWSCYGGRVYSTAMATLCLEVYYRYLPLYSLEGPQCATRPQPAEKTELR